MNPLNKYHNTETVVDGIKFQSKKEAQRWSYLRLLEKAGKIGDLNRQVPFTLIPSQREPGKKGKVIERAVNYFADFTYIDAESGELVVEDTKGVRTADYNIKRKLMLYVHGIRIKEV